MSISKYTEDYKTAEWDEKAGVTQVTSTIRRRHNNRMRSARREGRMNTLSTFHQIKLYNMEETILHGSIFCARQLLKETLE